MEVKKQLAMVLKFEEDLNLKNDFSVQRSVHQKRFKNVHSLIFVFSVGLAKKQCVYNGLKLML